MAAHCQLYLSVPAALAASPGLIEAALAATGAPSLLVTGEAEPARLRAIVDAVHRQNAVVLIENDYALAKAEGLDGVHLRNDGPSLKDARGALGPDKVVGVDCRLSRHEAMMRGEVGADYVAFGTNGEEGQAGVEGLAEMIAWWSALFEIPCVAYLPANATEADWRKLVEAGADFIVPGAEIWSDAGKVQLLAKRMAVCAGLGERVG
jgi:thiamine-phosphate pyrophosphorylase